MKLAWHATGTRVYETGVDRGVLYLSGKPGVPWNGLVSVSESKSGGDAKPYYVDGVKYLNLATAEEYQATITAFSAPDEFIACNGSASVLNGLFADQQHRSQFGFSYRSKLGNDSFGIDYGYKIHLVYNALAAPSTRDYKTLTNNPDAMQMSWDITTVPEYLSGFRPTAHFIVDSTKTDSVVLGYLESILYGTAQLDPRLPTPTELKNMFGFVSTRPVPQPVNILGSIDPLLVQKITNRMTNPDWETAGSTVVVRSNYVTNPDWETAGSTVVIRKNLVANPNFEVDTANWSANNSATPTRTTSQYHRGTAALQVVTPGSVPAEGVFSTPAAGQVTAGTIFSVGAWVLAPSGAKMRMVASSTGTGGGSVNTDFTGTGTWQFIAANGAIAASGGNPYIVIYTSNAAGQAAQAITYYIDEAIVEVGPATGPYFDGSTNSPNRVNYVINPVPPSGSAPASWFMNRPANGSLTTPAVGEALYTLTAAGTGLTEGTGPYGANASPGLYYAATIQVKAEGSLIGRTGGTAQLYNGASLGSVSAFTYDGTWQTLNIVAATAAVGNGGMNIYCYIPNAQAGDILRMRNPIIQQVSGAGVAASPFFYSGSTKQGFTYGLFATGGNNVHAEYDADLAVRWVGTANNSYSELYGTAPAGVTGSIAGRFAIIQSIRYALKGSKSARCIPLPGATGDEYIQFDIPAAARTGGTAFASRYQEAAVTLPGGAFAARALRTVIYTPETISSGMVNGPGWQEMRVTYPSLTSVYQMRLYHGGLYGSGDIWWDLAVVTEGTYSGPYFDGSTQPILSTNLAVNPNAVAATAFQSNNTAVWSVTRNAVAPAGNPQGITTAASSILNGAQSTITLMSMYNLDGLANTGPSRRIGAWFWVSASGYQAKINSSDTPTLLISGQWTWVVGSTTPGTSYAGAFVEKQTGQGNAAAGDIAYVTGVTAFSDGTVPARTIAGSVTPVAGFSVAWTGTVNASTTIMWDSDFNIRWQGTVHASISELTGIQPAGIKSVTSVKAILSTRWFLTGSKSVRLISIGTSTDSFVSVDIPAIARNITLTSIATSYMEVGVAGGNNVPRLRTVLPDLNGGLRTPGLVGTQEQRLTSSVTASPWELRLMHGGVSGSPDVWWDLSAIIDADYSGPSFDGDTPMFVYKNVESTPVWDGAANASTSHIEYYNEFLNPANQGDAYIIGSNLWVYNAGAWGNYGAIPSLT